MDILAGVVTVLCKLNEVLNADSIDAIIRQRVKIGMIGKALNLDGVKT